LAARVNQSAGLLPVAMHTFQNATKDFARHAQVARVAPYRRLTLPMLRRTLNTSRRF